MSKQKVSLAASAAVVDAAHQKAVNSRKNLKQKRTAFLRAQVVNQECENVLLQAQEAHEQLMIERI